MANGDKTKEAAFPLWLAGKSLKEIQDIIAKIPGKSTKPSSVRGWVKDWERGRQMTYEPKF